jgi:hypothetical protein
MFLLLHSLGIILTIVYLAIGLILIDKLHIDTYKYCFYFSAFSIYMPFLVYSFFRNSKENYIKVVSIFFSSIATLISIILFYFLDNLISYNNFWVIQIIIWTIVIALIMFSVIAVKGVRGN